MRSLLPAVPLLILALAALVPAGLVSPPDPLWIGGYFAAGDSRDGIAPVTVVDTATDGTVRDALAAALDPVSAVPPMSSAGALGSALSVTRGRAPPAV